MVAKIAASMSGVLLLFNAVARLPHNGLAKATPKKTKEEVVAATASLTPLTVIR